MQKSTLEKLKPRWGLDPHSDTVWTLLPAELRRHKIELSSQFFFAVHDWSKRKMCHINFQPIRLRFSIKTNGDLASRVFSRFKPFVSCYFHWLLVIFTHQLIGCCDNVGFGITTLIPKRPNI